MPLEIEFRFCGNVAILQPRGRIVAGEEARALETVVQNALPEFQRIVLNAADVTRLDSTGLGLLVRYATNLRKRGGDLRLAAPPPLIQELLSITLLNTVLHAYPTEQEALVSFLRQPVLEAVAALPGHRVLVVDRSPDLGAFVRAVLAPRGYAVKSASLVSDARVLLQTEPVNFILVGPGTPQLPAATVLAALRNVAPHANALQLTPEFRTFDAHQAAELLLEMFQSDAGSQRASIDGEK
ncbi:MAG: STAS domain-containing protein [Acidobacteriaceae bacterium]